MRKILRKQEVTSFRRRVSLCQLIGWTTAAKFLIWPLIVITMLLSWGCYLFFDWEVLSDFFHYFSGYHFALYTSTVLAFAAVDRAII